MHSPMHSHLKNQKNIVLMYSPMHSHIQNKKNRILCSHSCIFRKSKNEK